ncbi:polysaccharide biosynthesis protein [Bacteroidia bacterium]|nr:polysaccharide biosynthesis protein [Bacteroidia bacterium]GHV45251.1 polysaccharide biosynthesis protein [Bacteroidia bacterium]
MAKKQMKSLAKDTAIYGVSSIVSKFVNWLLVPYYTHVLAQAADYGIVTQLYAWTALLLVILTYGMETGLFRFINKENENPNSVYRTTLVSVGSTSLLFGILAVVFSPQIAGFLKIAPHPEYIWMLGVSVALDASACIPFAYLRYRKMPVRFAALKLLYVLLNVAFNLFFFTVCPYLMHHAPQTVSWFYNPAYGVGYVFVSNIISTTLQTLFLIPYIFGTKSKEQRAETKDKRQKTKDIDGADLQSVPVETFDFNLLKRILKYSLPLLLLGIMGILDQTLDKILYPYLRTAASGATELGIYGATSKIALIMLVFTQAFRYAYEPFVFGQKQDTDSRQSYVKAMTYFVIFSWLIFLGMTFYIDVFKLWNFIKPEYWAGFEIVPIVLVSFIFQGVYFNLSIWYKLTDKTMYGAIFSAVGTAIILLGNVLFVSRFGYFACVWAAFACYFVIMVLSYIFGQKYMPLKYELKKMGFYTALALAFFALSHLLQTPYGWLNYAVKTILLIIFILIFVKNDLPTEKIPFLNSILKKKL